MLDAMATTTAPFDPADRAHTADPAPHLAAARHGCPVSQPRPGLVVLAADTDVRAGLKDIARFSNRGAFSLDGDAVLPVPMITMTDPPEHTELRAPEALVLATRPAPARESLHHDAPLQYVLRSARTDTEVQGEPVAAGDKVLLSVQSANWDTTRWGADADAFSLDRLTPAAHLSFGQGIHTCLGAPPARVEVRVLVDVLLDRYPRLRLADGYRWQKVDRPLLRRPRRLDVVVD